MKVSLSLRLCAVLCLCATKAQELNIRSNSHEGTTTGRRKYDRISVNHASRLTTDTQKSHIPRRARSTQNRLHAALLRARLRQIESQGLSSRQIQTETPEKNYASINSYYIPRTTPEEVRKMAVKVDQLENWKQDTELRMNRMEEALEKLQTQNMVLQEILDVKVGTDEYSAADPKPRRSPISDYFAKIEELQVAVHYVNRSVEELKTDRSVDGSDILQSIKIPSKPRPEQDQLKSWVNFEVLLRNSAMHAESISNLTLSVMQQEETLQQQKNQISRLERRLLAQGRELRAATIKNVEQETALFKLKKKYVPRMESVTTENPHGGERTTVVPVVLATVEEVNEVVGEVQKMRKMITDQDKIINRLYARVGSTQRCCQGLALVSRRIGIVERRTKQSRSRADSAVSAVKAEKHRIDSITAKMDTQRTLIKRLLVDMRNRDRLSSQSNQRLIELMESHQEAMNETIMSGYESQTNQLRELYSERLKSVEKGLLENTEDLKSFSILISEHTLQHNITEYDLRNQEYLNSEQRDLIHNNLTDMTQKITEGEEKLLKLFTIIEELQTRLNNHYSALDKHKVQAEIKSNQLEIHVNDATESLRETTQASIAKHAAKMITKISTLESNITELATKAKLMSGRINDLRSFVESVQSLNDMAQNDIIMLKDQVTQHEVRFNGALQSLRRSVSEQITSIVTSATSRYNVTVEVVTSLNVTFENYRSTQQQLTEELIENIDQKDSILVELNQRTKSMENQQMALAAEVSKFVDTSSAEFALLSGKSAQNQLHVSKLGEEIANCRTNLSDFSHTVFERFNEMEATVSTNVDKLEQIDKDVRDIEDITVVSMQSSIADLKEKNLKIFEELTKFTLFEDRLNSSQVMIQDNSQALQSQQVEIAVVREGQLRLLNFTEHLWNVHRGLLTENDLKLERISQELESLKSELLQEIKGVDERAGHEAQDSLNRIIDLERSNSTMHDELVTCVQKMVTIEGGLAELKNADDVVSAALTSHRDAITKHNHLHRNLTLISEEVQEAMNDQGVALDKIREIMRTLNHSFIEGREVIDESAMARFLGQQQELKAMREVMQNFSKLVTKVLKDQLTHDINHVTIRNRQRSLMESYDSHEATISELRSESETSSKDVSNLIVKCESNTQRLESAFSEIYNHESRMRTLDSTTLNLMESTVRMNESQTRGFAELNTSLKSLQAEISAVSRQFMDLSDIDEGLETKIEELGGDFRAEIDTLLILLDRTNTSVTGMARKIHETEEQYSTVSSQITELQAKASVTYDLQTYVEAYKHEQKAVMESLLTVQNGLAGHYELIASVQRNLVVAETRIDHIRADVDTLNVTTFVSPMPAGMLATETFAPCSCNEEALEKQGEKISELNDLNQMMRKDLTRFGKLLPEMTQLKEQTTRALAQVEQQEMEIQVLNGSTITARSSLEGLRRAVSAQSNTLRSMHRSSADVISIVQSLQNAGLQHGTAIESLNMQTRNMKNKILHMESTIVSYELGMVSDIEKLSETIFDLEYNLTTVEEQLQYMQYDVDSNYNATQHAYYMLDDHDSRLTLMSTETNALLSSVASTVASMDYSLRDVNSTLSYKINDMDELLVDFQLAFDTSNRQTARFAEEFTITTANTTKQFNHFSTSIDYLTQIVHEGNDAVNENRERINLLNETVLFVGLSLPALLAAGVEEGLFEIRNDTNDHPLFSLEDMATKSLQRGDSAPHEEGSSNEFVVNAKPPRTYDLESVINGDADEMRIHRRVAAWITSDPSAADDDYQENYDFGSLERRKRVVKDVRRIDSQVHGVMELMQHLQSSIYEIGNVTIKNNYGNHDAIDAVRGNSRVSFSAGLTEKFACCGSVIFDKVFDNVGEGYNSENGRFTAPSDGHYIFLASISERNEFVNAAIVMNGMAQVTIRMDHNTDDYEQSQSTNTVILPLQAGDQVWVQTYSGSLLGYQYPAVTFTGLMV